MLLERLNDKVHDVRVFAVKALAPLQDASDPTDAVLQALQNSLANDPAKFVIFISIC